MYVWSALIGSPTMIFVGPMPYGVSGVAAQRGVAVGAAQDDTAASESYR